MSGTYLSSKATLDELLANDKFVYRAKLLVDSDRGTPTYLRAYRALDYLLKELEITERVVIVKSDGAFWYDNNRTPEQIASIENHNTRPEIMVAINYAFGNPVTNTKIYPKSLQSSCFKGYGYAERESSTDERIEQYVAFTYKPTPNPLNENIFTLRVSQKLLL